MSLLNRILACAALAFAAGAVRAQTVNVRFGSDPYTAASAVPGSSAGDYWNNWSAPNGGTDGWNASGFLDATGGATGIGALATPSSGQLWNGGLPGNPIALFDSYWHINELGTLTVSITGLEGHPQVYDLYVYAARNTGPESGTITYNYHNDTKYTNYNGEQPAYLEDGNYVVFRGLDADKFNEITFTGTNSLINGFTLVAVPEPGTYGLLGACALASVVAVRRRRKK